MVYRIYCPKDFRKSYKFHLNVFRKQYLFDIMKFGRKIRYTF